MAEADNISIKKSRAVAKRAVKKGVDVSLNDTSAEYEEFNFPSCIRKRRSIS